MNRRYRLSRWVLAAYCVYLILPLYWLLTLALRSNADIAGVFELVPINQTLEKFDEILSNFDTTLSHFDTTLSHLKRYLIISELRTVKLRC